MAWLFFALASALFVSIYYILDKVLIKRVNVYVLASVPFLITSFILFSVSLARGIPPLNESFFYATAITVAVDICSTILYLKSLKLSDVSLAVPILSFTPAFLIFTSFLVLGEIPSLYGVFGIFLLIAGAYFLSFGKGERYLEPFRILFKERGILYMFIVSFLFSIAAVFSKMAVMNSDPFFGNCMIYFLLGFSFLTMAVMQKKKIISDIAGNFRMFFVIGLSIALANITMNIAYTEQIASYVVSINRMSILFTVVIGSVLLGEKHTLQRIIGSLIMFAGVLVISFA